MNKYQESLDYLAGDYTYDSMARWDESVRTLQELIDFIAEAEKYCPEQLRQLKKGIATCKKKEFVNGKERREMERK